LKFVILPKNIALLPFFLNSFLGESDIFSVKNEKSEQFLIYILESKIKSHYEYLCLWVISHFNQSENDREWKTKAVIIIYIFFNFQKRKLCQLSIVMTKNELRFLSFFSKDKISSEKCQK
jgi:hypothetical protein